MTRRQAALERTTGETSVRLRLDLDGGERRIEVPDGFFGHMLDAFATHGGLGLDIGVRSEPPGCPFPSSRGPGPAR